jgi:hypothetical protein
MKDPKTLSPEPNSPQKLSASGNPGRERVADFCRRHGIERITMRLMDGVTAAHRVCNLEFTFAAGERHDSYKVNFKLQGEDARIGETVAAIELDGTVVPAEKAANGSPGPEVVGAFLRRIERRIGKIKQEQSVQSVTFLGSRFLLNGTTTFSVVSDDEGLLGIEIDRGEGRQPAQMMASNLLDGLYEGSIQLLSSARN